MPMLMYPVKLEVYSLAVVFICVYILGMQAGKTLVSLCIWVDLSESSLLAVVISLGDNCI